MDIIYEKPRTLYERFVNVYCRHEKMFSTKEQLTKSAGMKWKKIKGNREEVERYISTAPKPKHKQTKLNFGAFSSFSKANSLTMGNDDNTVLCVIIPPTSPSTVKLPSLSVFPAETPAIIKTAIDFERHKVKYFLENFSSSLITDDVMRNDSFISGFSKFVEKLSQFKSLESSYLDDVQRSKKSKFQDEFSGHIKKSNISF